MNADQLFAWRRRQDLTQVEAAAAVGIGARRWQQYEAGATIPRALALACGYVELFGPGVRTYDGRPLDRATLAATAAE